MAYMKCSSHRARSRLLGLLGKGAQAFYSFEHKCFHGVYWVPQDLMSRARALKGITRAREQAPDAWLKCW